MSVVISIEGTFRGTVTEYGIYRAQSGAIAIRLKVAVEEWFSSEACQWQDCRHWDCYATGFQWVVGKDGRILDWAVESLVRHAGWDGCFASIETKTWKPQRIQFDVRQDFYLGESRYQIGFLQSMGTLPRTRTADANELDVQFGAEVRAIASSSGKAGNDDPVVTPVAQPIPQPVPRPTRAIPHPQPRAAGSTSLFSPGEPREEVPR